MPLRLGIVGCGAVTQLCHLPALMGGTAGRPFRVTALVDRDPERTALIGEQHRLLCEAQELREQPPPVRADNIEEVLDAIDVAVVATAPSSHAKLTIQLLRAGKHTLVEKPVAATIEECVAIRDAATISGATVLPAHVRRFYPVTAWVGSCLSSGQLGTVRCVRWSEGAEYAWPAVTGFSFDPDPGGGVLADLGPHVIDLLGHWFGPLELRCCEDNSAGGVDSETRLRLRARTATIEVELSRLRGLANAITIVGTDASLRVDTRRAARYQRRNRDGELVEQGEVPAQVPATLTQEGLFHQQFVEFDRALRGEPNVAATLEQAMTTVELLQRCRQRRTHGLARPWQPHTPPPGCPAGSPGTRRVVVTGATGFIGAHVVERLLAEETNSVVALVRASGRQARLSHTDRTRLTIIPVDLLGDTAALQRAFRGCDVVVHAAYGNAGEPARRWAVTVDGTEAVLAAARKAAVGRLVHVSSVSVYDPTGADVIDEDTPLLVPAPGDLSYAQQKLAAELLVLDSADEHMQAVCLQPTVVYGPWGPLWTLRPLRRLMEDNTALPSGPSGPCDVVHVHDVADAVAFLTRAPAPPHRRFLVSGPEPTTWGEFYDHYRDMLSLARLSPAQRTQPHWNRRSYAGSPPVDTSRLAALGFRSRIGLSAGMELLGRWARWAGVA